MKIAYIILTHQFPKHLSRLISALTCEQDSFFVHVDSKKNIEPFKDAVKGLGNNIHFVEKRENGRWGDYGIVKATINSLKRIKAESIYFDRVVLLSGQDYPIRPTSYIRQFFETNMDKQFISFEAFPVSHLNYGGMDRIHHYSINLLGKRLTYLPWEYCINLNFKGKIANLSMGLVQFLLPKRKFPSHLTPFYGSQWWNLTGKATNQLLEYIDEHPEYMKYHKYSLVPDEMFFQSLLLSFADRSTIVNRNLRFIKWDQSGTHPATLETGDLDNLIKSDELFARKFVQDSAILDNIDKHIFS